VSKLQGGRQVTQDNRFPQRNEEVPFQRKYREAEVGNREKGKEKTDITKSIKEPRVAMSRLE